MIFAENWYEWCNWQGPKLQGVLCAVLTRFKKYQVGSLCDVAEIYTRIGLTPKDRKYHCFLWKKMNEIKQHDAFESNRLVFGLNSTLFEA